MSKIDNICTDFNEWPSRWMGDDKDLVYGHKLLEIFRPFTEQIISSELTDRLIKNHIDNLWLLGGKIIKDVSIYEEYDIPPVKVLLKSVDSNGGKYCRSLQSKAETRSFDKTCALLAKYLESKING